MTTVWTLCKRGELPLRCEVLRVENGYVARLVQDGSERETYLTHNPQQAFDRSSEWFLGLESQGWYERRYGFV